MIKYYLFICLFAAILYDASSQSKWIGGVPILFYQNHVTACGPYHFVADGDKLYRNTPDFTGWERINVNLSNKSIWSIHAYGNRLVICTDPGNIYFSDDFGKSFIPTGYTGSGPDVEFFQTNDSIIYFTGVNDFSGINRFSVSYDGGTHFQSRLTAYKGGGAVYYRHHGLFIENKSPIPRIVTSNDHFRTYAVKNGTDISSGKPSCMAVLDSTFFVGTDGSPNIYFTRDFGDSWDSVFTDARVSTFYELTRDDHGILASTNAGILRSNADGTSWTLMPYDQLGGWPEGEPNTTDIYVKGDTLYASLYDCMMLRSIDGGNTWNIHLDGIYGGNILHLYDDGTHLSIGNNEAQYTLLPPDFKLMLRRSHLYEQYNISAWQFLDWLYHDGAQFSWYEKLYTSPDQGITFIESSVSRVSDVIEHLDTMWYASHKTVYYSADNGQTWKIFQNFGNKISEDIKAIHRDHGVLSFMAGDISSDTYLYTVSGFGANPQLHYQSSNASIPNGFSGGDSVVVADSYFYGIPISIDSGKTWTFKENPDIWTIVWETAYLNGVVIVATYKALFAYGVNSDYWVELEPQLFRDKDITAVTTYKGNVYVAVEGEGIYELDMTNVNCLVDPLRSDCAKIAGSMFYSAVDTCVSDSNAIPMTGEVIEILPGPYYAFVGSNGEFLTPVDPGEYTVQPLDTNSANKTLSCPSSGHYEVNIDSGHLFVDTMDFIWKKKEIQKVNDLSLYITCFNPFRLTQPVRFEFLCKNRGNTRLKPHIEFSFPASLDLLHSDIIPSQSSETNLVWDLDTLSPWKEIKFNVDFMIDHLQAQVGDTLGVTGLVLPIVMDTTPIDNVDRVERVVNGALDPNDKLVEPLGRGSSGFIPKTTEDFDYTIRFQNTGTDTAFSVVIIDTLDERFDLSTIRIISSSPENSKPTLKQNVLNISFPDIMLPDSNKSYFGSQGYFRFRIRPKEALREGDQVKNQAHIIFDLQPPVSTNVTLNTVEFTSSIGIHDGDFLSLKLFPNPALGFVYGRAEGLSPGGEFHMYDVLGREVKVELIEFGKELFRIGFSTGTIEGVYIITYFQKGGGIKTGLMLIGR